MSKFDFNLPLAHMRLLSTRQLADSETEVYVSNPGDWIVRGFRFGQPTLINGLLMISHRSIGTGVSLKGLVGISTSIGPNGLFPSTINNLFCNQAAGIALTVNFSYSYGADFYSSTLGSTNYLYFTNNSSFTCDPTTQYYAGIYISSASTAGTIYLRANNATDNTNVNDYGNYTAHILRKSWQRISGSATTYITESEPEFIPYYYDGTKYTYYPDVQVHQNTVLANMSDAPVVSSNRIGFFFELNDIGVQELYLKGVQIDQTKYQTDAAAKLWVTLHDGYDITKIVATGVTFTAGSQNIGASPSIGTLNYFFSPSVRISPDYKYFVGFGYSSTVNSGNFSANDQYAAIYKHPAMSDHATEFAVFNPATYAITHRSPTFNLVTSLLLESTLSINRGIGN